MIIRSLVSSIGLTVAEMTVNELGIDNIIILAHDGSTGYMDHAPFDAICAFSILHLLDDLDAGLVHMHGMLKPGGFLITKTACLRDMSFALPPVIKVMQWIGKAPHVSVFTGLQLEAAFEKAGFELIETGYHGKTKSTRFIAARRK